MDREINLDPIRALEKQIQDHESDPIQLKRARNSPLNISTHLPPEILGNIFLLNVIPDGDFSGLIKGSYNFLLVCRRWYEVALCTPKLWSSWGNTIRDWSQRYARCRSAPLDLVLSGYSDHSLDDALHDALQDRVARDLIRRVHLKGVSTSTLDSVISSIITEGEETQSNNVESLIIQNSSVLVADLSRFFSRYRLPKLKRLHLMGCNISSWDLMKTRIASLTTLSLITSEILPTPTLSQLLSILSTNPNLQQLTLSSNSPEPLVDDYVSSSQIQLHHLKKLHMTSVFRYAFGLLDRLELPDDMDDLKLSLSDCSPSDLLQTLGPYLRDRIQHRSRDSLGLLAYPGPIPFSIKVGDVFEGDDMTWVEFFVTVEGATDTFVGEEEAVKLCLDVIAQIPQERIVDLATTLPILRSEELCVQMCNLASLHLRKVDLSKRFIEPDIRESHTFEDLLPRLHSISINEPYPPLGDWTSLTNFLTRRAAAGKQIALLRVSNYPRRDVIERLERVVKVFESGWCDEYDY